MSPSRSDRLIAEDTDRMVAMPRILVVDDNDDNRDMLTRRLQRKRFDAEGASDGPTALEMIAAARYDLVLLDWMMPGMTGLEVLAVIRENHGKTELPVLMATAKADSEHVVEALDLGANDYITKPIDFPVLLARIGSHIDVKKEAQERSAPVIDVSSGIEPGTVVDGRYELGAHIGEGGFAAVYRAKQLTTDKTVAFKVLLPHRVKKAKGDTELLRFLREMKVIGELEHPNIVRLIDSGQIEVRDDGAPKHSKDATTVTTAAGKDISGTRERDDGGETEVCAVPFIVMECLEGETLAQAFAREKCMAPEQTVDLVLPILSALALAHERGVVHRDMKPHNVFLVTDHKGVVEPKVLDFGIAKLTEPGVDALTKSDAFIGTPEYMAPEQGRGKRDVDGRADQFSVAAIAYQALTGRKLYAEESFFAMIHAVAAAEFATPSELGVALPPGLETVLLTALAKDRERRYDDCDAFGRALLPFASHRAQRRWADAFHRDLGSIMPPKHEPDDKTAATAAAEAVTRRPDGKVVWETLDSPGAPAAASEDRKVVIHVEQAEDELEKTVPDRPRDNNSRIAMLVIALFVVGAVLFYSMR